MIKQNLKRNTASFIVKPLKKPKMLDLEELLGIE